MDRAPIILSVSPRTEPVECPCLSRESARRLNIFQHPNGDAKPSKSPLQNEPTCQSGTPSRTAHHASSAITRQTHLRPPSSAFHPAFPPRLPFQTRSPLSKAPITKRTH